VEIRGLIEIAELESKKRVCAKIPDTFWGYKYALPFVGKRAALPPLPLVTIAAMLPKSWNLRLVDTNITELQDSDIAWADYAMITGMAIQKRSALQLIDRCHAAEVPVVCGGPLFTMEPEAYPQVDHLVLDEGEITLPMFLSDLEAGKPQRIYRAGEQRADLTQSPVPMWHLLDLGAYAMVRDDDGRIQRFRLDLVDDGQICRRLMPRAAKNQHAGRQAKKKTRPSEIPADAADKKHRLFCRAGSGGGVGRNDRHRREQIVGGWRRGLWFGLLNGRGNRHLRLLLLLDQLGELRRTVVIANLALQNPQKQRQHQKNDRRIFGDLGQRVPRTGAKERVRRAAAKRHARARVFFGKLHEHEQDQQNAVEDQQQC